VLQPVRRAQTREAEKPRLIEEKTADRQQTIKRKRERERERQQKKDAILKNKISKKKKNSGNIITPEITTKANQKKTVSAC
jgi:uncharacterized protein with gpF-like domain